MVHRKQVGEITLTFQRIEQAEKAKILHFKKANLMHSDKNDTSVNVRVLF